MGIQKKVAWFLVLVLLVGFGVSTLFSTRQTVNLLSEAGEASQKSLKESAVDQAQSVFASLEIGTKGSLQQGEMELFADLVTELGAIPKVMEVGLADSSGRIGYSNRSDTLGRDLDQAVFRAASAGGNEIHQVEETDSLLLSRAQRFGEACLDCHEEKRPGDLGGVLYVRFSLESLHQAEAEMSTLLAEGKRESTISGLLTGLAGLLIASAGAYFMLGSLVRKPLVQLQEMIEELEMGRMDHRLNIDRKDEIGQMGQVMDRFADSLENEVTASLQKLADGDLTIAVTPRDGQDKVRGALKSLGEDLGAIVGQIQTAGEQIASGSLQVSDSSQSLSQGATESAASLEEISASLHQLTSQTKQNAENATQASHLSNQVKETAEKGNGQMVAMSRAMEEINEAGQSISKIIKVIDEIAFQTNLLALNAAVEAARAGQHGKGFAVVAEEVRNLAARSAKAASETADLIEGTVEKTANGTRIAGDTAEALGEIVGGVTKVSDLVAEIAAASNEQAQGIGEVSQGLGQIDQVTQQNTAAAEQSASASEELSSQAMQLQQMLTRFRLKEQAAPKVAAARRGQPKPQPQPKQAEISWNIKAEEQASPETIIALDDEEFGKY